MHVMSEQNYSLHLVHKINQMKGIALLLLTLSLATTSFAQISQGTLSLFAKKTIPYEAPAETFSDQYLEDGEESSIPYKMLTKAQLAEISGEEDCRCAVYAVDQIPLKSGKIGLVVYQINEVDVMPYEELTYHLYIVDEKGKPVDNTTLNAEFYTSIASETDEISVLESKTSHIAYGEYDDNKDRLFVEMTYETNESLMSDFGQSKTTISNQYQEIVQTGKIVDVTVYMEN